MNPVITFFFHTWKLKSSQAGIVFFTSNESSVYTLVIQRSFHSHGPFVHSGDHALTRDHVLRQHHQPDEPTATSIDRAPNW